MSDQNLPAKVEPWGNIISRCLDYTTVGHGVYLLICVALLGAPLYYGFVGGFLAVAAGLHAYGNYKRRKNRYES